MPPYGQSRKFPFSNPLANALVVIVGALAMGASVVLGFVALIALGSLLLVLVSIVGIRLWWFRRKLRRGTGAEAPSAGRNPQASRVRVDVIEGEYHVVSPPQDSRRNGET